MNTSNLFSPLKIGDLLLPNRVVMAPLTRSRAGASRMPNALMAEYYAQRAAAGKSFFLVVKEARLQAITEFFPEAPLERTAELRVQQQAGHQSITWLLCRVPLDAATAAKIKAQSKPSQAGTVLEPGED